MIKYNTEYYINNNIGTVKFIQINKNIIAGIYFRGTITAKWDGEILKGKFYDAIGDGEGLIEFHFNEIGFNAKWKGGLNEGPMKGKWRGSLTKTNENDIKLKNKKEVSIIEDLSNLVIELMWSNSTDFDLAVAYKLKNDTEGIIYFGNKGSLTTTPFIELNKDSFGGESEIIKVNNLDLFKDLYIICWDFSHKYGSGAFEESEVNIHISSNNGNSILVSLENELGKDAACIAHIKEESGKYKIQNVSKYFERKSTNASEIITKINL
jgi:uncharacterized protein involved in tellurium resistance